MFLNDPRSDDAKFFKDSPRGPGRSQLGRAAEFLGDRAILSAAEHQPKLRSAAWIQSEAARKLVAMGGLDLDKLFEEAQSKDFKPVELPMRLQARSQPSAPVRREKCTCGIAFQGSAATEAVLYTAQYDHLGVDLIGMATTFLTARLIMRRAAPCSWS